MMSSQFCARVRYCPIINNKSPSWLGTFSNWSIRWIPFLGCQLFLSPTVAAAATRPKVNRLLPHLLWVRHRLPLPPFPKLAHSRPIILAAKTITKILATTTIIPLSHHYYHQSRVLRHQPNKLISLSSLHRFHNAMRLF